MFFVKSDYSKCINCKGIENEFAACEGVVLQTCKSCALKTIQALSAQELPAPTAVAPKKNTEVAPKKNAANDPRRIARAAAAARKNKQKESSIFQAFLDFIRDKK